MLQSQCPQCDSSNQVGAKFCANCGHALSALPSISAVPTRKKPALPQGSDRLVGIIACAVIAGLCILCVLLFAGLILTGYLTITPATVAPNATATLVIVASATPSASPTYTLTPSPTVTSTPTSPASVPTLANVAATPSADALERAKRGTVFIMVPADAGGAISGSGSVVTKAGHILTNNHIIADKEGKLHNAQGRIYIAFPSRNNLKASAEIYYRATLVRNDLKNDLALLKITATKDGGALPADLGLAAIPIGDSDPVDSGNEVTILGYPSLGGDTLTITRGIISGFLMDEGYIKTDAEINSGNSGGPAFNLAYEQIGIASAARIRNTSATVPGKIGLIRPINLAHLLIDLAKREAGE